MRKSRVMAAAIALAIPGALLLTAPAAQAANDAKLSVLHGVPGLTVDVWVNGQLQLNDFKPGSLAGPLDLPAGTYSVAITDSTATSATDKVAIGPVDLPLAAGMNYTAVAFLGTDGKPTAKLFTNDIAPTAAGQGRVTVRHVANAPEVTVTADGAALGNVANPDEIKADVPAKTYAVAVTPTSGGAAVFSTNLPVKEGVNTIVYAWGDITASPSTFAVATQEITGLHSAPAGVPAGEAGLANDGTGLPAWAIGLMAAAALGLAFSAVRLRTARARS
jgi:hypothetical protein